MLAVAGEATRSGDAGMPTAAAAGAATRFDVGTQAVAAEEATICFGGAEEAVMRIAVEEQRLPVRRSTAPARDRPWGYGRQERLQVAQPAAEQRE